MKNKVVSISQKIEMKNQKLSIQGAKLAVLKLQNEAESNVSFNRMQPEKKLFLSVVFQAIRDISGPIEANRKSALNFINGECGMLESICDLAGLNPSNVQRIIRTIYAKPAYKQAINPNDDFIERARKKRVQA